MFHKGTILALCSWNKQVVWKEMHNPYTALELFRSDGSLFFHNILSLTGFELMLCARELL